MEFSNTYVTIDLDALKANFKAIREKAGVPVMAVVKADAYGHGAVAVARELEADCAFFGVSSPAEALELHSAGIQKPILILGHVPPAALPKLIGAGIRVPVCDLKEAETLSREAEKLGIPARFHFAVDTGMSRIGFQVTEADADTCARIASLPYLEAEGIFSHFATADCADLTRAKEQARKFDDFCQMLEQRGLKCQLRHMDNSAGIMNFNRHYDMVRAGIVLYGLYPSDEVDPSLLPLRPVLQWHSRVTQVKTLEPGRQISYGGTFVTERPTVVATVSAGYADGYRRSLSSRFFVLIKGRKAPILGRICMDQMMVDVTEIPGVAPGDTVTLLGRDGEENISAEQISAGAVETFNYEFVCGISRRVPRVYYRDGKILRITDRLL